MNNVKFIITASLVDERLSMER